MATFQITKESKKALGELFQSVENFNTKHSELLNQQPDLKNQIKTMAKKNYVGFLPISSGVVKKVEVTVFKHLIVLHDEKGSQLAMGKYVDKHNHFTHVGLVPVTKDDYSALMEDDIDHESVIKKITNDFQKKVERVKSPETYMEMLSEIN